MHILDKIVAYKKTEVAKNKELYPISKLEQNDAFSRPTVSLSQFINRDDKSGIIAEFKRKSPSKPSINLNADVTDVTTGYAAAGASALSVLTDQNFFGGNNKDVIIARSANSIPILRKDFIIDPYQIIEARSIGADAILLISEILTKKEILEFSTLAAELDMEILLELHDETQLVKYNDQIHCIGVNNRNLKTFKTDINFSKKLISKLPSVATKVSESGIRTPEDVLFLRSEGYAGFLIGERFMATLDPSEAALQFIQQL